MVKALNEAAARGAFDEFLEIKNEAAELAAKRRSQALEGATIKKNRKGELIVELPETHKPFLTRATASGGKLELYKIVKSKVNLGAQHPADTVDKEHVIRTGGFMSDSVTFPEAINQTYDGNVQLVQGKGSFDVIAIDDMQVTDEYKNHGVEKHVLGSLIHHSRTDLYDFVGSDKLPHEVYEAQGFEPNPYYYASQTHPVTGVTYPSKEELDKLERDSIGYDRGISAGKFNAGYAYIRNRHGKRISDIPLTPIEGEWSREDRAAISKIRGAREDAHIKNRREHLADYSQA